MYNHRADNAGAIPEEGDFVAYNYSGQIATGWIYKITPSKGYRGGHIIKIKQLHPHDGAESIVRGGFKCVLVLEKGK